MVSTEESLNLNVGATMFNELISPNPSAQPHLIEELDLNIGAHCAEKRAPDAPGKEAGTHDYDRHHGCQHTNHLHKRR